MKCGNGMFFICEFKKIILTFLVLWYMIWKEQRRSDWFSTSFFIFVNKKMQGKRLEHMELNRNTMPPTESIV